MRCPYCKADDDHVVNSRTGSDGTTVKRRRECNGCGRRFTTYERVEDTILRVIKKDGGRENFSRAKILRGLTTALYKRPVPMEEVDGLVDRIERDIHHHYESEVPSSQIGEMVMEQLRGLDQVAFIRFASVYREFKDVSDFVQEAGIVLRESGTEMGSDAEASARAAGPESADVDQTTAPEL